jgi:sodium/bile acid cotransporter 7
LIVGAVMFLMALALDIRAMWRVVRDPLAPLLAIGMNSVLLPLLAWALVWLLRPLLTSDLAAGLIVAAAVPCTLASAAMWTRRSGGNEAVALFVTVATNLACFLVTPAWLAALTAKSVDLNYEDMVRHLAILVVLPIALAQLLRQVEPVRRGAARTKVPLGFLAQVGILAIVFVGSVDSGLRLSTAQGAISLANWGALILAVLVLHLATLFVGLWLAEAVGVCRADAQAVGIAGSQKTLMVGLEIAVEFYGGLAMLPLVVYHVAQLLVDTLIADRWRSGVENEREETTAEGAEGRRGGAGGMGEWKE